MSHATAAYEMREYKAADQPAVLDLLQRSLAGGPTGHRSDDFFDWKHVRNPFGASITLVAEAAGELVGFRTFMRWRFLAGQRTIQAVRAVDTATAPEHQGRGVFTRLTRAALDLVRAESIDLIFNTPNAKSRPGYLKLGWKEVGRVPISVRPLRPLRVLLGAKAASRGSAIARPARCPFPPARQVLADTESVRTLLTEGTQDDGRLTTHRTVDYLRWRYSDAPDLDYRAVTVYQADRLAGLAIGRPRQRGPLTEFTLSEVLARRGDRRATAALLHSITKAGGDHVAAHLTPGTPLPSAGRRHAYVPLPGRGLTLVANPLGPSVPDPLTLDSWRLSLGDLEVF